MDLLFTRTGVWDEKIPYRCFFVPCGHDAARPDGGSGTARKVQSAIKMDVKSF